MIIDMKVQIWLPNVKYVALSRNTSWTLVICRENHVFTILKVNGINKAKQICLHNKENINGHRWIVHTLVCTCARPAELKAYWLSCFTCRCAS